VQWVRERVRFVIQAFTAGDPALAAAVNSPADVILVDSPDPGSGRVFDWRLAEGAPSGVRILLAGGLTPHNVGDAIRLVRPWGVDVASGVEVAPGSKDPRKLRLFIEAAREGARALNGGASDLHGIDSRDEEPREARQVAGATRPFDWQFDE
jgi:phosphoribosylanthranilate isomerase